MTTTTVPFAPPGPGTWQLDAVHFPRPVTRLFAEMFPAMFNAGFREGAKMYGSLLDTLEFGSVNGLLYFAPRGVGAPKSAKGPPPKFIFKALLHLHPEARRRVATARTLFEHLLARRNPLGLLSEDMHPNGGELWGNFPQTYSMVGLINSAMRLSRRWEELL